MPVRLLLLLGCLGMGMGARAQQGLTHVVFAIPLSAVTLAGASAAITDGSIVAQHLIKVEFPTAVATVTGIQVRIEATRDGTLWFPISADLTSAPLLGGLVYAFVRAYGTHPAIRVNSVLPIPGAPPPPMTVRYTGQVIPALPFLTQLVDRWAF